jgi:hypothetical protein
MLRHRLVQRKKARGEPVNARFDLPDIGHQLVIALDERANAAVNGGFHQTAHLEDFVLQFAELGNKGPHGRRGSSFQSPGVRKSSSFAAWRN